MHMLFVMLFFFSQIMPKKCFYPTSCQIILNFAHMVTVQLLVVTKLTMLCTRSTCSSTLSGRPEFKQVPFWGEETLLYLKLTPAPYSSRRKAAMAWKSILLVCFIVHKQVPFDRHSRWLGIFRQLSSFSSFYWIDLFNKSWRKKKVVWNKCLFCRNPYLGIQTPSWYVKIDY